MSIFFWIYRLVGTVHSGLKGGQIFVSATHRFLKKRRLIDVDVSADLDELAGHNQSPPSFAPSPPDGCNNHQN